MENKNSRIVEGISKAVTLTESLIDSYGLTSIYKGKEAFAIVHMGNMGNTIENQVRPNVDKMLGQGAFDYMASVGKADGSPDYQYTLTIPREDFMKWVHGLNEDVDAKSFIIYDKSNKKILRTDVMHKDVQQAVRHAENAGHDAGYLRQKPHHAKGDTLSESNDPFVSSWNKKLISKIKNSKHPEHIKTKLLAKAKKCKNASDAELVYQELDKKTNVNEISKDLAISYNDRAASDYTDRKFGRWDLDPEQRDRKMANREKGRELAIAKLGWGNAKVKATEDSKSHSEREAGPHGMSDKEYARHEFGKEKKPEVKVGAKVSIDGGGSGVVQKIYDRELSNGQKRKFIHIKDSQGRDFYHRYYPHRVKVLGEAAEQKKINYRFSVTVSNPNHTSVDKRDKKTTGTLGALAIGPKEAEKSVRKYYENRGFIVHDIKLKSEVKESRDAEYMKMHGMTHAEFQKLPQSERVKLALSSINKSFATPPEGHKDDVIKPVKKPEPKKGAGMPYYPDNNGRRNMGDSVEMKNKTGEKKLNEWADPGPPCKFCGLPHGQHRVKFVSKNPKVRHINPDDEWASLDIANAEDHDYTPIKGYRKLSQDEAERLGFDMLSNPRLPDDIYDRIAKMRQQISRVGKDAGKLRVVKEKADDKSKSPFKSEKEVAKSLSKARGERDLRASQLGPDAYKYGSFAQGNPEVTKKLLKKADTEYGKASKDANKTAVAKFVKGRKGDGSVRTDEQNFSNEKRVRNRVTRANDDHEYSIGVAREKRKEWLYDPIAIANLKKTDKAADSAHSSIKKTAVANFIKNRKGDGSVRTDEGIADKVGGFFFDRASKPIIDALENGYTATEVAVNIMGLPEKDKTNLQRAFSHYLQKNSHPELEKVLSMISESKNAKILKTLNENKVVDIEDIEDYMHQKKTLQGLLASPEARNSEFKKYIQQRLGELEKQKVRLGLSDVGSSSGKATVPGRAEKQSDAIGGTGSLGPLLAESGLNESHFSEIDMIVQDIISGERNPYFILSRPNGPEEKFVAELLQKIYDQVAHDTRYHPDDDFEEILEIVVDRLRYEYNQGNLDNLNEVDMGQADRTLRTSDKGQSDWNVVNRETGDVVSKHKSQSDAMRALMKLGDDDHELKRVQLEDLDANQKRAGQLGPTEKVGPKGAVGKLVGANESKVNEGQEDLDAILRIVKK